MGIIGDQIRFLRDLTKGAFEECGGEGVVDEIKDIISAIRGK